MYTARRPEQITSITIDKDGTVDVRIKKFDPRYKRRTEVIQHRKEKIPINPMKSFFLVKS